MVGDSLSIQLVTAQRMIRSLKKDFQGTYTFLLQGTTITMCGVQMDEAGQRHALMIQFVLSVNAGPEDIVMSFDTDISRAFWLPRLHRVLAPCLFVSPPQGQKQGLRPLSRTAAPAEHRGGAALQLAR